jgi:hypothetical protein
MTVHARVLDAFQRRLTNAVTQSPLLRVRTARTGRLLDLTRLRGLKEDLPEKLLETIIGGMSGAKKTLSLDLRLRSDRGTDHDWLRQMLDERLRRHSDLAKRETGVHALWLAHPLFFAAGRQQDDPPILAPVFLWPAVIISDTRSEGRFHIGRSDACPPRLNPVLATWIRRQFHLDIPVPDEEDLLELSTDAMRDHLTAMANCFNPPISLAHDGRLRTVPNLTELKPEEGPAVIWSAVLGYFRFPNEAILSDLEALRDMVSLTGAVSGFVSGTKPASRETPTAPPEDDRYLVTAADFSQEQAVWQARNEPGVVIHGPPGTGKSQAIVNIIADSLAHGRRVLMVCQKPAATRVVLERLRAVGLGDLCVEVHDPEGDRQEVFKAVREQVENLPNVMPANATEQRLDLARQITALEAKLDAHAKALHERHPGVGLSFQDVLAMAGSVFHSWPTVRDVPMLQTIAVKLNARQLDDLSSRIEAEGVRFRKADPVHNPWRHRQPHIQPSAALRSDVIALLTPPTEPDRLHLDHISQHGLGQPLPSDLSTFQTLVPEVEQKLRPLVNARETSLKARVLRAWLDELQGTYPAALELHRTVCEQAVELAKQVASSSLKPSWEAVLSGLTDAEMILVTMRVREVLTWENRWQRWFSWQFHKAVRGLQPLLKMIAGDDWWADVKALRDHLQAREMRKQLRQSAEKLVPDVRYRPDDEAMLIQYPSLALNALLHAFVLYEQEKANPWLTEVITTARDANDPERLGSLLDRLALTLRRVPLVEAIRQSLRTLSPYFTEAGLREPSLRAERGDSIVPWLDAVKSGLDGLDALIALDVARSTWQGVDKEVLDALEVYEARRDETTAGLPSPPRYMPPSDHGRWWLALVRYTTARTWQSRCLAEQPILRDLAPDDHALAAEQLTQLLDRKLALESATIRHLWLSRQIVHREHPWKQLMKLRGGSKGEATRLREAVTRSLPCGLLDLRPVWLVNPETVSRVLPLTPELFHVVIFDEASQCPLEQSIPAIYRGQTVIVSGDEKQLPPTGFFSANLSDDLEESDAIADADATETPVPPTDSPRRTLGESALLGAEDLLEAAVGHLPECSLRVHYRSEHPALIEYSNRAFYGGRLETPPPRRELGSSHQPIIYQAVAGRYHEQTNATEADAVIEMLRQMWSSSEACPSVGVVTFNQPQRELIEDRLAAESQRHRDFAGWLERETGRKENNQDVGFFVKNLENVQGDERDVMIFSTTFGVNADGRFIRNFGPLSAVGGERRLNVAVTRAKRQLRVVGSMPIDRVAPTLLAANPMTASWTPASYLQLYLAYAEAVSSGDHRRALTLLERLPRTAEDDGPSQQPRTPLERAVWEELSELVGDRVECGVGAGGFRIDLAVRHSDPARGYVLGVECDGGPYFKDRASRHRDGWRQEVLARLGWTPHRIWSVSWWDNRTREVEKLRQALLLA